MKKYISQNISYLREEKGFKKNQLAVMLKKSGSAITEYETGKTNPKLDVLLEICDLFEVKLNDLVHEDLSKLEILGKTEDGKREYGHSLSTLLKMKMDERDEEIVMMKDKMSQMEKKLERMYVEYMAGKEVKEGKVIEND